MEGWYQDENNNVNMDLLKDFSSIGLNDAAIIGKEIVNSFNGYGPRYSYWNGCSTGGRQGLMLAQRYPTAYDGILVASPAINWPSFLVSEYWPQMVMNELGRYPPRCITDAITAAAVKACDDIDPFTVVDQEVNCDGESLAIAKEDAMIAQKIWEGFRSANGTFMWYGLEKGSQFSWDGSQSLAATKFSSPTDCTGLAFPVSVEWITEFVLQDPSVDVKSFNRSDLVDIFYLSKEKYDSIIGMDDPDLSAFKQAGGKMITWHGLSDELIFQRGTEQYYNRVKARDSGVEDFYRFLQAPGVLHCHGGNGPVPTDPLRSVVAWVEEGVSPDVLPAVTLDKKRSRNLACIPWFRRIRAVIPRMLPRTFVRRTSINAGGKSGICWTCTELLCGWP